MHRCFDVMRQSQCNSLKCGLSMCYTNSKCPYLSCENQQFGRKFYCFAHNTQLFYGNRRIMRFPLTLTHIVISIQRLTLFQLTVNQTIFFFSVLIHIFISFRSIFFCIHFEASKFTIKKIIYSLSIYFFPTHSFNRFLLFWRDLFAKPLLRNFIQSTLFIQFGHNTS